MDSHDAAERIDALLDIEDRRRALVDENSALVDENTRLRRDIDGLRRELGDLRSGLSITVVLAAIYGLAIGAAGALAATHWAAPIIDQLIR